MLWEPEEIARSFDALKRAGKVRYFGVSNQNRFQMAHLQRYLPDPLVVNQLEMNLLHHGFAEAHITFNQQSPRYPDGWEGVLEYCREQGVLLQAWRPLAQGLLSGASLEGQPEPVTRTAQLVTELAARHHVSREAMVLAWLLRHPAGIQPVLGTIKPTRLKACAEAARGAALAGRVVRAVRGRARRADALTCRMPGRRGGILIADVGCSSRLGILALLWSRGRVQ